MLLLALLASAAPGAISRDRIMAFLWPESDSARASNSLRQALHSLRRDLGEDIFLPETASGIQLDPDKVSADLWVFRDAIARKAPDEAAAAYRGPFLDGVQASGSPELSRWIDAERERLSREHVQALDFLARQAEEALRYDEAVAWRRRQAAADPFSSRAALNLLQALVAAGDSTGALKHAAIYEELVRTHLEVDPDPAVMEFVASLRHAPLGEARLSPPRGLALPGTTVTAELASSTATGLVTTLEPLPEPTRRPRYRPTVGAPWLLAAGVIGFVGIGAGRAMIARDSPAGPVIVLTTGASPGTGRDTANVLIACDGPACPEGGLPQASYVVATHLEHTNPASGTRYIAPAPLGTTLPPPGYACCSTAVFENSFALPANAASATITITLLADNQATVAINGVEFGRHAERLDPGNHGGAPTTFATTFLPHPTGVNRLRVTLWDGGGAAGLNYRAFVTHDTREENESDE